MSFHPTDYGAVFSRWIDTNRTRPLDAGSPVAHARGELRELDVDSAFADAPLADRAMAECCISAVWLLYDFLDESHTISQGIQNASGSFWHAIMHRREGDYSNAKYWFRQVGDHAVFPALQQAAEGLAGSAVSETALALARQDAWDPFRFVDLCQAAVRGRSADEPVLRKLQQAEWELLFDHCYRRATGSAT
jgi:hypothetical protein